MQEYFNLEIWELGHSRPELLGGGSEHPEDPEELIYLRVSLEQRPPVDHLGEDGADAPDVKWTGVLGAAKENLTCKTGHSNGSWHFGKAPLDQQLTSGALYHKVTTSCVYTRMGIPKARAKPKSAILMPPFWSIRRFCGFMSLCKTLLW